MATQVTFTKAARVTANGDRMDLRDAIDAGAYRFVGVRLKVLQIEGGPTGGTLTVAIRQALHNESSEYGPVRKGQTTELTFDVANDAQQGDLIFDASESITRFLIWEVTSFWTGGTNPALVFSLEGILK